MRENAHQNNSEYGHFSRSACLREVVGYAQEYLKSKNKMFAVGE